MKMSARLLTLALIVVPAVPGAAATATAAAAAPAAGPVVVARYTFDAGVSPAGRVAENSGRGLPLTVRAAGGGAVRFLAAKTGRYAAFPARCAAGKTCARALLEAASDADLNPGTRPFRWGASVSVTPAQVAGSSNVMQKGIATTDSQWKLQIGATHGRAQCVVVGRGSAKAYVVRSTVAVADGKWHRIECQRGGAVLTVAVDGVNRGRIAVPAALSITNTLPLRIGGPNFNTSSDMYHGYLDDVSATLG
jgi:concanavalin A-like lectin/glucanase superfamily protein